MPWENSIHGVVLETLNLMRLPEVGDRIFVQGEVIVGVQHCLLVRNGMQLSKVKKVLSHEQALGQCKRFLTTELPHAEAVQVASTANAAQRVAAGNDEDAESAAICSSICAELYPGLEIARRSIQDFDDNFTRFLLLSTSPLSSHLISSPVLGEALFRISLPVTGTATLSDVFTRLPPNLVVSRMDRKPALPTTIATRPFHDVYFVAVRRREEMPGYDAVFVLEVEEAALALGAVVEGAAGEATLLAESLLPSWLKPALKPPIRDPDSPQPPELSRGSECHDSAYSLVETLVG